MLSGSWKIILPLALMQASVAQAQAPGTPTAQSRYVMPATQVWDMPSDDGEIYRIFVSYPGETVAASWPATKMPENGWPVLYVLDGNAMFASFAEARRLQERTSEGRAIVVAIGYPGDAAYDARRLYDLTAGPIEVPAYANLAKERSGGRNRFLDFLTGKLRQEIGRRFPIDPARQSLFGHSLGGLFAIHALYARPDAFHAVIAASPSLFWHEALMLKEERDFSARLKAGKLAKVPRLLVVAGEREEAVPELWDTEAYVRRMDPLSAFGFRLRSQIYADEAHMTVPTRAVPDTLRFATSWP